MVLRSIMYIVKLGTRWFGYELVLGTSWLGYELAWYDLVRVRVDWKPSEHVNFQHCTFAVLEGI